MSKKTIRIIITCFIASFLFLSIPVFSVAATNTDLSEINIWSSSEDYINDYYLNRLKEKFPDLDLKIEYLNTSTIAAKVLAEGKNTKCDIIIAGEYGYLQKCEDHLAELTDFDYSLFLSNIVPDSKKYTPQLRNGGAILINKSVLDKKGASAPKTYADLLKPEYKNLIVMPNPKSSGTGYMFLRHLTNEWGEEKAFKYFEKLTDNMLKYYASGMGPVSALVQGEAAVALGITAQAVTEINKGVDLEIVYFKEGSPYSMYGSAIIKYKKDKKGVKEVFDYLSTAICKDNNKLFYPEQIFKNFAPKIKNYPTDIPYGNMKNDTLEEKERLLKKWIFS